jgi:hypothetical protein
MSENLAKSRSFVVGDAGKQKGGATGSEQAVTVRTGVPF